MKMLKWILFYCLSASSFSFTQTELLNESSKLFGQGKYLESEKILLNLKDEKHFKLTKAQKISVYTDLGKININFRKYQTALQHLIKAKNLNVGDSVQYGNYYTAFGQLFDEIGAYSVAIEYYKKAFNYSAENTLGRYFHANIIGSLFLRLNEADSALYYFNRQLISSNQLYDYVSIASSINNVGLALLKKKEPINALSKFYQATKILTDNKSKISPYFEGEKSVFFYIIQGNIGHCYYVMGKYDKAISPLKNYFTVVSRSNAYNGKLSQELMLVSSYLKLNKIDEAKSIESILLQHFDAMNLIAKLDFLTARLEIALYEKDYDKAANINEESKRYQQIKENEKIISTNNMSVLVSEFLISEAATQRRNEEKEKLTLIKQVRLEKKENTFMTILLISILMIFSILTYLYIQYTKNKRKQIQLEKEFLILEEEKLNMKVKAQENYLTEFAIDNKRKKDQTKELLKNLNFLVSLNDEDMKKQVRNLIVDIKGRQIVDKSVEELNDQSELLLIQFKTKLLQLHPILNSSDVELCSLIKLNLSNKEIAVYKNVTDESVKIFKNRLKKKMQLSSEQNLNTYISSL